MAFNPDLDLTGLDVMHLDNNKDNNTLGNLRHGSRKCNEAFKIDYGTHQYGGKNHAALLDRHKVNRIREYYATGEVSQQKLAEMFGISQSAVSAVCLRKRWGHLDGFRDPMEGGFSEACHA
jgi:predicted XRE-type DNA-binding protein